MDIKTKVWKKLQGWKKRLLSQGGKEVLIKVVALSIPTYSMSCFKLLESLCRDLENMMAKFWWGQRKEENKTRWVSWFKMCAAKFYSGLGFKNQQSFNVALLAKQAWRIMNETSSILYKVYKSKYFPNSDFQINAQLGNAPSYAWRGIWESKGFLLQGYKWHVGNGKSIKIWIDLWLPSQRLLSMVHDKDRLQSYQIVAHLIDEDTNWWDAKLVTSL
ncbi:uncharacterized mitochondrial protein AtMg00310-like [Carya illinoinensis]|uniref:uncharacterized mitochondrial protein AtMg00310-like n=1 Tax=Carya illinoinensis TaxID=32201 RepID=UPI001C728952|nr:uncharacterized mitochondrial protein AtMg00310-like [Carya illinoinensis]